MKWQEIEQSPRYINASEEQKTKAKNIYFDKYAMPKFQEAGIDTETARTEFFNRTSTVKPATQEQQQAIDEQQEWIYNFSTPEWVEETKSKGPIGAYEAFEKLNKWEMIPFLNAKTIIDDISIINQMKKVEAGTANAEEEANVNEYLTDMAEIQLRGYSLGGKIVDVGLRMPAYAIEFAISFGTSTAAKTGAKIGAKIGIKKTISTVAKTIAKKGAKTAAKTGTYMGHRVAKKYLENNIGESVAITNKGQAIFTEAQTKPATALFKAYSDVLIENLSEMAGGTILKPVGTVVRKGASKLAPNVVKKVYDGMSKTLGGKVVKKVFEAKDRVGFNGIIEELGEERLGDIMRVAIDVDEDKGFSFEQLQKAINPGAEQWTVELGLTTVFGASSIATNRLVRNLKDRKVEPEQIKEIIDNTSETEKDNIVNQLAKEEEIENKVNVSKDVKKIISKNIESITPKELSNIENLRDDVIFEMTKQEIIDSNLTEEEKINNIQKITDYKDLLNRQFKEADTIALEQSSAFARELQTMQRIGLSKNIDFQLKDAKKTFGTPAKGKYDYETNKKFTELKRINKLTKSKAFEELESTDLTEDLSEFDSIKARLLEYKSQGSNASKELQAKILEDIRKLKEIGKKAIDEKNFEELVNRNIDVSETIDLVNKSKADSDKISTKSMNALLSSTGNFETFLNILGGKKLRDKFTVIENQKDEFNSVARASNKVVKDIADTLDVTREKALNELQNMNRDSFEVIKADKFGKPQNISVMNVIDIYNAIKNNTIKEDFYRVYGQEQIDNLVNELTPQQKEIGDKLNDTVKGYYNKINRVFIELYNRDLPRVENYWMSSAENQSTKDIFDSYAVQSKNPSFTKQRARTRTPLIGNAYNKTMSFIQKAEYYDNTSLKYRQIEKTLRDSKVKKTIVDKRGADFYKSLMRQLEFFSLNQLNQDLTSIEKVTNKVMGNWVKAKIGLNPSVAFKQLSSVVNYAENMPSANWVLGFTKGVLTPKATFDFVWNNSEYIRNRYNNGYSEALQSAMNGVNNLPKAKGYFDKFSNFMTSFTRLGDVGAIIYGGAPYIKHLQNKGMSLENAIKEFELTTLRSQQSPFSSTRSTLQNSKSPFIRLFMAFSNTTNQYMRKFYESQAQYSRGEISLADLGKTYAIYGIINPAMYVWLGAALGKAFYDRDIDEEKTMKEMSITMLNSPIQAIPFINDMAEAGLRAVSGLRVYDSKIPAVSDMLDMVKDIGTGEWIESLKTGSELITGAPTKTLLKLYDGNIAKDDKDKKKSRKR